MTMEGKTHFEKIIGENEKEREIASQELQALFENKDLELAEYELKKSPEDLEVIKKTELIVDNIIKQYGGVPKILPIDNIYMLKPGSVLEMTKGELVSGVHKPMGLKVGIEKEPANFLFARKLAHELFHLKSYKSARVGKSGEDVRLYRSGLSMVDRKNFNEKAGEEKEYFAMLEEAIVTECTKKFFDKISNEKIFSEEIEAVRKLKDWAASYYRRNGFPEK